MSIQWGGRRGLAPVTAFAALFALAATAACSGEDEASPDLRASVWDPSERGPWPVGIRTAELYDAERERTFSVDVWYPAALDAPGGVPNEYTMPVLTTLKLPSTALRDAVGAEGQWPLVLFSHGFGGIRFQTFFMTEHLASHGFVVVAPDHPGNTFGEFSRLDDDEAILQSSIDRPVDMLFALDWALAPGMPGGHGGGIAGAAAADAARVGVTGHSFGGWTALEVARLESRVDAIFPLAPGFKETATPDFVAELARPILLFGGSKDETTPFETDQLAPYDFAQPPKYLVEILGAGHLDFSNLCEIDGMQAFLDDGCDPEAVEPLIVQARVNTVATAFVQVFLLEDERYAQFLDAEYVLGLGNVGYTSAAPDAPSAD